MIDKRCDAGPQVLSVADVFRSRPTFARLHWPSAVGHLAVAMFAMLPTRFDLLKLLYRCRARLSVLRWLPLFLTTAVIGGNLFVLHVAGDDDIGLPPPKQNPDISCEDGELADQSLANPCCRGAGRTKDCMRNSDTMN